LERGQRTQGGQSITAWRGCQRTKRAGKALFVSALTRANPHRVEEEYTEKLNELDKDERDKIFGITYTDTKDDLRVKNIKGDYFTTKSLSSDSRVAAIIFSLGKNKVADDDNANLLKKTFVYDGYVENEFDDVLTWLSRNTLMNHLIRSKNWP